MEVAEPLAIRHVTLASGDMFDVARIDEDDLQAPGFEDIEDRDPVHARGFHRDAGDPTGDEPVHEPVQPRRERVEGLDR